MIKKLKWKLLIRLARLLGYNSYFNEKLGLNIFCGDKHRDKGWFKFSFWFKDDRVMGDPKGSHLGGQSFADIELKHYGDKKRGKIVYKYD